jgi:hypothetical protein
MELLSRPMPKLIEDNEPVLLLTNLAADRPDGAPAQPLPIPGPPRVAGEDPWRELQMLETRPVLTAALERPRGTAEVGKARTKYSLRVETQPAGASLYVNDELEPACMSPCDIQVPPGSYSIRAKLAGYDDELTDVKVGRAAAEVALTLTQTRGSVLIDTPVGAAVKVNGGAAGSAVPMVLSLAPGLYRFTLESGSTTRDQFLMIKPGAMLRLRF